MKTHFLGKSLSGPFTIPSGIVATAIPIIEYLFRRVPQIGVMTTKSIGLKPRLGYREPVLSQFAPGCFVNAIGLTNPGAHRSAELFAELTVPEDRFLLVSIFGGSVEEFVEVAKILAPYSDGLELNLSCPHAKGYGMAMGQDPELVQEITAAVKAAVNIPIIPKLTPNAPNIGEIAQAAVAGGADALCAINTVGPGYFSAHGHPVLSNELGGISGKGTLPTGLQCVRDIMRAVDIPVIACGGVSCADDVREYQALGASIVGVGSALFDMTSPEIEEYFSTLAKDLSNQENNSEGLVSYEHQMQFSPVTLTANQRISEDISILTFDNPLDIKAGEFVFLWLPGLGEKPFSALSDDPFQLVVIDVGEFTKQLITLKPGTRAYVRGPYGIAVKPPENSRIIAVAGGTGLAGVYQIARDFKNADIFIGARSTKRLYFLEECEASANLHIATDDGSLGFHGLVTELLQKHLTSLTQDELANTVFYNCGPAPMVHAAQAVQRKFCNDTQIFNAIDYLTKCGVGICGACYAPDGQRLCVDGPFLQASSQNT